jgi:hypothetical protein
VVVERVDDGGEGGEVFVAGCGGAGGRIDADVDVGCEGGEGEEGEEGEEEQGGNE